MKKRAGLSKLLHWGRKIARSAPYNFCRARREPTTLILMYHRVCALRPDPHLLCVHPDRFRQQMTYLKSDFDPVPLSDWDRAGSLKRPRVAITFDDGYADNFINAWPILEELSLPATIFICTGPVEDQQEFPTDRLDRVLDRFPTKALNNFELPSWWRDTGTPIARAQLHQNFYRLSPGERNRLLSPLEERLGLSRLARSDYRALSVPQLQQLAQSSLITIGGHTLNHPCLACLTKSEQEQEINGSLAQLSKWLNRPVQTFAYPYGKSEDYNLDSVQICQTASLNSAVTTTPTLVWADAPRFQLPRFPVRNWSLPMFRVFMELFQWL